MPSMYVDPSVSSKRRTFFSNNQAKFLGDIFDPAGPYFDITVADFVAMFRHMASLDVAGISPDTMRLYFAMFSNDTTVPPALRNKFTIVFSAAKLIPGVNNEDGFFKDLGHYCNIAPGGSFDPANPEIDATTASTWVSNWQTLKLPMLPVDHTEPNMDNNGNFSDTKSVNYAWVGLLELIAEAECQVAEKLRFYIASYADGDGFFPKRLTTQIEFVDKNGIEIIIDTNGRTKSGIINPNFISMDTGSPCPPASGCQGVSLP